MGAGVTAGPGDAVGPGVTVGPEGGAGGVVAAPLADRGDVVAPVAGAVVGAVAAPVAGAVAGPVVGAVAGPVAGAVADPPTGWSVPVGRTVGTAPEGTAACATAVGAGVPGTGPVAAGAGVAGTLTTPLPPTRSVAAPPKASSHKKGLRPRLPTIPVITRKPYCHIPPIRNSSRIHPVTALPRPSLWDVMNNADIS
ncbi:hypothetical protein Psi01_64490 [Planobispora siamensis]|uniref:Uncharacterized protein n=1 Tax=Planobispora siamensis TaxID=936338 RepID=A0A8J3SM74_9ACTN|nr:hypothetical protein Psi01_64490 [Planobispora siamensis]